MSLSTTFSTEAPAARAPSRNCRAGFRCSRAGAGFPICQERLRSLKSPITRFLISASTVLPSFSASVLAVGAYRSPLFHPPRDHKIGDIVVLYVNDMVETLDRRDSSIKDIIPVLSGRCQEYTERFPFRSGGTMGSFEYIFP